MRVTRIAASAQRRAPIGGNRRILLAEGRQRRKLDRTSAALISSATGSWCYGWVPGRRPLQARLLIKPLRALWEVGGDLVGDSAVVDALSRHRAGPSAGLSDTHLRDRPVRAAGGATRWREMPPPLPLPCRESARPGGLTATPGHPCMRPAMLSAARRS